jgi:hypothetical protein
MNDHDAAVEIRDAIRETSERLAVAIDRLAQRKQGHQKQAHELADAVEAMCLKGGDLEAAPSQTRALLFAAASVLRRCP